MFLKNTILFIRTSLLIAWILYGFQLSAQAFDCPEVNKYKDDQKKLNDSYEKKIEDFKNGYYCSKCGVAKSEFEARGESFEQHLQDVQGEPVPATREMYDKAYQKYSDDFDRLTTQINDAQKSCQESWEQEQERLQQEMEREREGQIREYEAKKQAFIDEQQAQIQERREERLEAYKKSEETLQNILNSYRSQVFGNAINEVADQIGSNISEFYTDVKEMIDRVDFDNEDIQPTNFFDGDREYSIDVISLIEGLKLNEGLEYGQWGVIKGIGMGGDKAVDMVDRFLKAFMDPDAQLSYEDMNAEIEQFVPEYFTTIFKEYVKDMVPRFK